MKTCMKEFMKKYFLYLLREYEECFRERVGDSIESEYDNPDWEEFHVLFEEVIEEFYKGSYGVDLNDKT